VKSILVCITITVFIAFPVPAQNKTESNRIRIGILNLDGFGDISNVIENANDKLVMNIRDVGFYDAYDYRSLQNAMKKIGKGIPEHCRDPRCVLDVGNTTRMDRMLYGSFEMSDNRCGISLTLIDVVRRENIQVVNIQGAPGVPYADVLRAAVARLHGSLADSTKVTLYHGPKVHNEKQFLYSGIGLGGSGLLYGVINYVIGSRNFNPLEAEYVDDELASLGSSAAMIPLFARPAALANAYVAASDDAYGVLYNPAGMAWVRRPEAAAVYQFRFGIDNIAATYVNKATREIGFGHALLYSADRDHLMTELYFVSAVAYKFIHLPSFIRPFSLGASLKVASTRVKGTMEDSPSGTALGIGLDLGFLWEINDQIRYGFLFKNLPLLNRWKNESTNKSYFEPGAATLHMGGSFKAGYTTFLIAEGQIPLGKEQAWVMSGGIEQEIFRVIFIRAGLQKEIFSEIKNAWKVTSGFGINFNKFILDGSYEYNTNKMFDVINVSLKIGI